MRNLAFRDMRLPRLGANNLKGIPGRYSVEGVTPLSVWDAANQIARSGGDAIPLQTLFANTRNGEATYVDASGAIVTQTALKSITNHYIDGVAHALFQPSRTNSLTHSTLAGATVGVVGSGGVLPTGVTVTSATEVEVISIVGSRVALKITTANISGGAVYPRLRLAGGVSAVENDKVTFSCAAKLVSASNSINIRPSISYSNSGGTSLSETQGPVLGVGVETSVEQTITAPANTATARIQFWVPAVVDDGDTEVIELELDIPQLELGAFATTYIPTAGTAVTRLADAASCSLTTLPVDTTGGTIFVEGRAYYEAGVTEFSRIFQIDDGTNDNSIQLFLRQGDNDLQFFVSAGGVAQISERIAYTSGEVFSAAVRFAGNDGILSLNGSNSTADTSVTMPNGLTTFRWAQSAGGQSDATVAISKFRSFDHEFTTAEINAVTGA